jgi:hypothetical protein
MSMVVKKPKKYRPAEIQNAYDQLIAKNRQLKETIDDTERRSLESLTNISLLMLRRWWHRTRIRLGMKQARSIEEFNIEPPEMPLSKSAWSETLKKMEARACEGDQIDTLSASNPGISIEHARTLMMSKELSAKCDQLYSEYREKIWQRRQSEGKDVQELDSQIEAILVLYQRRKATYEKTIKELDALERGD